MKSVFKKIIPVFWSCIILLSVLCFSVAADTTNSITITGSSTVSLEGKQFKAYKIMGLELVSEGYKYTVIDTMKSAFSNYFSVPVADPDFNAKIVSKVGKLNSTETEVFAKKFLQEAKTAGIVPVTKSGTASNKVVFDNLALGYYLIEDALDNSTAVSAVMLNTNDNNIEICLKADIPTIDKKVNNNTIIDSAIGNTVNYKITSKVPDMTGYNRYYYILGDKFDKGISVQTSTIVVKVNGVTLNAGVDYTALLTPGTSTSSLKITFINFLKYKSLKGKSIEVSYNAIITNNAYIGETPNKNTASIVYSNNPQFNYQGVNEPLTNEPTGKTNDKITEIYLTDLCISKVNGLQQPLQNVEFSLSSNCLNKVNICKYTYTEDVNGTYCLLDNGCYSDQLPEGYTGKKYLKESVTTEVAATSNTVTGKTDANGYLKFSGLSSGTYTLSEVKALDGYNKIVPITFTITFDSATKKFSVNTSRITESNNHFNTTIVNQPATILPQTGSYLAVIITLLGTIVIIGGSLFAIKSLKEKKKKS